MKPITSVMVAALFAGAVGLAGRAEAVELRVSNPVSASDSQMWADTGKVFVEAVAARSNGEITFSEHHGGSLISGFADQPKGIGSGLADFGALITAYTPSEFPMDMIGSAVHPAISRTTVKAVLMDRILLEEIPAFTEQYTNSNVMRLFVIGGSAFQLFSTRPVETLADFEGLKVRVYGSYQPRALEAVDAVPVALSYGEILDGLHKKVIDATLINPINGRDNGYGEVAKYVTMMGAGLGVWLNAGLGFAINLDTWEALPADAKRIMLEEARKVELGYAEDVDNVALPKALEDLKAAGLTIRELPASEMDKWSEMTPDFFSELAAQLNDLGLPGDEAIKRYEELYAMSDEELRALYDQVWEAKLAAVK